MAAVQLHSKLNSENLDFIVQEAKDYALSTGLVMGVPGTEDVTHAPICLLPSPFPQVWFSKAQQVQTSLNLLLHRVAKDVAFLNNCLQKTSQTDEFIRKLLDIIQTVSKEGYSQTISLGLFRMDYMLDTDGESIIGMKQVEMNTIASSLGCLVSRLHPLHNHLLKHLKATNINYPESNATEGLAKGLVSAWRAYNVQNAIVVFAIQHKETNISDQRLLEYSVYDMEPQICVRRYTLDELYAQGTLKDRRLFVGRNEVAVVYYRTGYIPELHQTDSDWAVRLMIERSRAIQCPNIALQLAGMKKVQQELTRHGVIRKFLADVPKETIDKIKSLFAGQFSLDLNEEGDAAVEMALVNPERYVLKPQREGGGNNFYGVQVAETLRKLSGADREAYVLMELISPPAQPNYVMRRNKPCSQIDIVAELGIYGVILADEKTVLENFVAGHMLRCKAQGVNEGGVAVGYGALNLPYLV